jgi:hypothetical protein
MNRRDALRGILLSCSAPYFVPVERLMRIKPIVVPCPPLTLEIMQEAFANDDLLHCMRYQMRAVPYMKSDPYSQAVIRFVELDWTRPDRPNVVLTGLSATSEPPLLSASPPASSRPA